MGWTASGGSKIKQKISVPKWIKNNKKYTKKCLKGLFETDGSVYLDRKYLMVNFTTAIPELSRDVMEMILKNGFRPNLQFHRTKNGKIKYTIRISKNAGEFIKLVGIEKNKRPKI